MKRGLGKLETQFIAWIQLRKRTTVRGGTLPLRCGSHESRRMNSSVGSRAPV